MAVTKRTRFEVLRRDKHTCQYCGAKAPDVELRIDHVEPVALGGSDKPENLVAACHDCNAGKTSIAPDSPLVKGLSDRAAAYALGMVDKMTRLRASFSEFNDEYFDVFWEKWHAWNRGGKPIPLPDDVRGSLFRWYRMGVPTDVFDIAIPIAMKAKLYKSTEFKYFAGVVWNIIDQEGIDRSVTVETAAVYTQNELEEQLVDARVEGRDYGDEQGWIRGTHHVRVIADQEGRASYQDFLQNHIDGTTTFYIDHYREAPPWRETEQISA